MKPTNQHTPPKDLSQWAPPEGYFEQLPSKVLAKINARKRRVLWGKVSVAVAASLALLWLFVWPSSAPTTAASSVSVVATLEQIPQQDIQDYLIYETHETFITQYASVGLEQLAPDTTQLSTQAVLQEIQYDDVELYLETYY